MSHQPRPPKPGVATYLPHVAFAIGAAVIAAGLLLDRNGTALYVPNPPFVWRGDLRIDPWVVATVAVLAGAVALTPRLLKMGAAAFAAASLLLTLLVRLGVAAASTGPGGWDRVFDPERSFEAANEYIPALPALRYGPHIFLDRFAEIVPSLPVHAAGHPPGLLLTMDALGIGDAAGLAALCIGVAALGTPLLYWLARRLLHDDGQARVAALLLAMSPSLAVFGTTSPDALFMTLGIAVAVAMFALPRWIGAVAGAVTLAVSSLFAWSLLAVGAWGAFLALVRQGWRFALALSVICGLALVGFYALLHAATGFDPIGTLVATEDVYRAGIARGRPYWYWLLGSPTAFLTTLGLPIAWYAFRALGARSTVALAIFAVLAIASVLGFTKAETERIWLFFAPFVCLAAATVVPQHRTRLVLGLLAVQALATELLVDSVW